MKVIFLDHDGVICLSTHWGGRAKKKKKYCSIHGSTENCNLPVDVRFDDFDSKAIRILNEILEESGAEIVVSSDWKLYCNLEEMKDLYNLRGIQKSPIDFTPNHSDIDNVSAGLYYWKGWTARSRVVEIREYLKLHPEVTHWVAIDDLEMGAEGLENFILCSSTKKGIKAENLKEQILNFLS
jgi:hypothetical protein